MKKTWLVGAVAMLAATPLAAQNAGTLELGLLGRYHWFGESYAIENNFGVGARAGYFLINNLALEGTFSAMPSGTDPVKRPYETYRLVGNLVYNLPIASRTHFLLGGGVTQHWFRRGAEDSETGFGGLAGFRQSLGDGASLRAEFTLDYMGSPAERLTIADKDYHYGVQLGFSGLIGGKRGPRDSDRDGVLDNVDRCPNTPAGEAVDAEGCPLPKDADKDGVLDTADRCPDTPAGDKVDAAGCSLPKDADGDGVLDTADRCPNTPRGDAVDANGCSLPKDADKDGVTDDKDRCPNTPAGEQVDANGCPLPKDGDNDGVTDDKDKCPNSAAGEKVDANGCRVLFEDAGAGKPKALVLQGVNFETGKADLKPESEEILRSVAQSLVANPDVRVEVGGHTDSRGSAALNRRLSAARAASVRQFLIDNGVPATQLTAKGYGPSQPIGSNKTEEGRAQNRRTELKKLD